MQARLTLVWSVLLAFMACCHAASAQTVVRVYAAGSLKGALTEAGQVFTARQGIPVTTTFGPSGLLRDRLRNGEVAEVFASADMAAPQSLAASGLATPPVRFARSTFCALFRPGLEGGSGQILQTILRPDVRLGTSTPGADPGGDYAWKLFQMADRLQPGSYQLLSSKALRLVGGPDSPKPPVDRPAWAYYMEQADVFLLYCPSARQAARDVPGATIIPVPKELDVQPEDGLTVLKNGGNTEVGQQFADFLLSGEGQAILAKWGFGPP